MKSFLVQSNCSTPYEQLVGPSIHKFVRACIYTRELHTYTCAMRVKHLCITEINANHSHSFSLALFPSLQLLQCSFYYATSKLCIVVSAIAIHECTACANTYVCPSTDTNSR